jgi:hypothetical protein
MLACAEPHLIRQPAIQKPVAVDLNLISDAALAAALFFTMTTFRVAACGAGSSGQFHEADLISGGSTLDLMTDFSSNFEFLSVSVNFWAAAAAGGYCQNPTQIPPVISIEWVSDHQDVRLTSTPRVPVAIYGGIVVTLALVSEQPSLIATSAYAFVTGVQGQRAGLFPPRHPALRAFCCRFSVLVHGSRSVTTDHSLRRPSARPPLNPIKFDYLRSSCLLSQEQD